MRTFKRLFLLSLFVMLQGQARAETPESVPLYRVTVVQESAKAINYRYMKSSTEIDFKGTVLLHDARGEAKVKSRAGATEIEAEFKGVTPATQFGPEYLTYVLWAISPEGRPTNLGELIVKNGKSKLKVTCQLQAFGLIVTAEPYFAVSQPSNVVVMENALKDNTKGKVELIDAKYDLLQRGQYTTNIVPAEMAPMTMDSKTPFAIYQARNALRIAKAAGAETYATDAYHQAQSLLREAETARGGKKGKAMTARESVQRSEDARLVAVKRQEEIRLANERQGYQEQVSVARTQAAIATQEKATAEAARSSAEQARVQSEAERMAAEQARAQSDAERMAAEQARAQSEAERNAALLQAQKAEAEKAALRTQLLQQLNSILQTRDTARGLIVNMSDVLFQTGKAELRPAVREKLAKIAGIVIAHPGLKLEVEGHTDNVGGDEYNQTLSEHRAQNTRDYLVSQGVKADSIVSRGFGKTKPVDSNDTVEGRARNRRVELVVSGDLISARIQDQAQN